LITRKSKLVAIVLFISFLVGGLGIANTVLADDDQQNTDKVMLKRGGFGGYCDVDGPMRGFHNLDKLLEDGKITQDQYDGMQDVQSQINDLQKQIHELWINGLLDNGIIDQEQYDAIQARQAEMAKLRESLKNMTAEERQEKMAELRETRLQELLDNGKIDQKQYDAMIKQKGKLFRHGKISESEL